MKYLALLPPSRAWEEVQMEVHILAAHLCSEEDPEEHRIVVMMHVLEVVLGEHHIALRPCLVVVP